MVEQTQIGLQNSELANEEVKDTLSKPSEADLKAEFEQFMTEMKRLTSENNKFTQDYQLNRLLNSDFINPYEILELEQEANDAEIKKRFRMISILIHPDKCKHEKAPDAFHVLEQAYKTLMDPEKRRMYQRVMREARERVEAARRKENIRRLAKGLDELTKDTVNVEV